MEDSTTEVLYHMAYSSFLLQRPDFKMYYEMLKDQFVNFPESFKQFSKPEVIRIKQMKEAYNTGRFVLFEGYTLGQIPDLPPPGERSEKKHYELCKEIFLNRENTLEPYTGKIDWVCPEFPVIYGNIDLMVQSGFCAYIVEVKTDTAEHDIIGQVIKYFIGLSLKLILKHFNEVKIITIAPGYKPEAFNGLQQIGAVPLLIDPKNFSVRSPVIIN